MHEHKFRIIAQALRELLSGAVGEIEIPPTAMATNKVNTVSHLETGSDPEKLNDEEVKGTDFTVSDSELPDGYFTSANFVGSSKLYPFTAKIANC